MVNCIYSNSTVVQVDDTLECPLETLDGAYLVDAVTIDSEVTVTTWVPSTEMLLVGLGAVVLLGALLSGKGR